MKNPIEIWQGKKNPFRDLQSDLQRFETRMERMFDDVYPWPSKIFERSADFAPSCDVTEDKNGYSLKFDMPGIPKNQIKVEIADNTLTVSAERKAETTTATKEGARSYRSEISYGWYVRSLALPTSVDEEKIEAHFENGVLEIKIPKNEPAQAKQIDVH